MIEKDKINKGEKWGYNFSFDAVANRLGSSLNTSLWTVDGGAVTLGTQTQSGNVATVIVNPVREGCAMIKVTATMADETIVIRYIEIKVVDPMCQYHSSYSRYA